MSVVAAVGSLALPGATSPATAHSGVQRGRARTADARCADRAVPVQRLSDASVRSAVICLMNAVRARFALPPLTESAELDQAAQTHTDEMTAQHYFAHPSSNGSTPGARVSATGYDWNAMGEDIAAGARTPYDVVALWMSDVGHCTTVLDPDFANVGIGVSTLSTSFPGPTWTADLGLPSASNPPSTDTGPQQSCPHPLPTGA